MIATMNSHHNANVATEATRPTRTRSAPAIVHAATNIAPIEATGITSDSGTPFIGYAASALGLSKRPAQFFKTGHAATSPGQAPCIAPAG